MATLIRAPRVSEEALVMRDGQVETEKSATIIALSSGAGDDGARQSRWVDKRKGERRALHDNKLVDEQMFLELKKAAEDAGRKEGMEKGWEEGRQQGLDAGEQEASKRVAADYDVRLKNVADTIVAIESERQRYIAEQQGMIVKIMGLVIGKLVGEALLTEAGVIMAVEKVIATVASEHPMRVLVSKADYPILKRHFFENANTANSRVKLEISDLVKLGGCVVETPLENVDGRVEVQLQALVEMINNITMTRTAAPGTP